MVSIGMPDRTSCSRRGRLAGDVGKNSIMLGATGIVLAARRPQPLPTVLVGAGGTVALEGARRAHDAGLITPTLIGRADVVRGLAATMGWDISGIRLVPADDDDEAAKTSVSLVRAGEAAALMKGHLHTDVLLRAVLDKVHGLRAGRRLTHVFHMTLDARFKPLLITDAAVNVAPDHRTLCDIVLNAADLARGLGEACPRIAMISGTEEVTASMPSSVRAGKVVDELRTVLHGQAELDGPLALDNAVSFDAARIKGMGGNVAGQADILVVPNIETGNALFKAMVFFQGAIAAGIVLGARVPIMLNSRSDLPDARLVSAALASLYATPQ